MRGVPSCSTRSRGGEITLIARKPGYSDCIKKITIGAVAPSNVVLTLMKAAA